MGVWGRRPQWGPLAKPLSLLLVFMSTTKSRWCPALPPAIFPRGDRISFSADCLLRRLSSLFPCFFGAPVGPVSCRSYSLLSPKCSTCSLARFLSVIYVVQFHE